MFLSLISGSSGNASLIKNEDTTILIDCGLSLKRLSETLDKLDIDCEDIDALLITHEHSDHIIGAGVLSRKFDIPIYTTEETHKAMNIGAIKDYNIKVIDPSLDFEIGSIGINTFQLSHDATNPIGYSFYDKDKKYSIVTDTGIITEDILKSIHNSDYVMLEANHDVDMLMYGKYPFNLKKRILSDSGHMSNDYSAKIAFDLLENNTKNFMLSHLSDNNNTPDIAYRTVHNALLEYGAKVGEDISLCVANRYEVTSFI